MPNAPKTPVRGFRIPDDVYRAALRAAEVKGEVLSEEVRAFLERYPKMKHRRKPKRAK